MKFLFASSGGNHCELLSTDQRYDRKSLAPSKIKRSGKPSQTADLPESDINSFIDQPVVRLLMAVAAAFQDVEAGKAWLSTRRPSLGNVPPILLISKSRGRKKVANELGLIEHGMF